MFALLAKLFPLGKPNLQTIFAAVAVALVFYFGFMAGKSATIMSERKYTEKKIAECSEAFSKYKKDNEATVAILQKNANDWKDALESAQNRAIQSSREITRQQNATREITNLLNRQNIDNKSITRGNKNGCTLSDVVVNTDTSDRLRNCYGSADPRQCASGSN